MRLLLSKGANANAAFPEGGATALHLVVAQDHNPSILHLLLEYGAHVDARGTEPQGETPFHIAAQWGRTMAARILLHWGADVNATYHDGQTALHRAAAAGQWKMILLLLSEGADITAETKAKDTAFSLAAVFDRERVVKLLLDKGASLMSDSQKARGFISAAGRGRKSVVATLIDRGIAVDATDESGLTALNVAAMGGHEPVVALLLEKGADINARNNVFNATALQLADMNERWAVVHLLQQAHSQQSLLRRSEAASPRAQRTSNTQLPLRMGPNSNLEVQGSSLD
jgi:ankyrin repeat protein